MVTGVMSRSWWVQVILQISALLRDVHATGHVHRDFKPSNVLWIDDKQEWAMVGFDQAAAAGSVARLSTSTLAYTAPEVLAATCEGDSAMHVSPAIDAWSLGVVVLELLLAEPAFPPSSGREEVRHTCRLDRASLHPQWMRRALPNAARRLERLRVCPEHRGGIA